MHKGHLIDLGREKFPSLEEIAHTLLREERENLPARSTTTLLGRRHIEFAIGGDAFTSNN